MTQHNSRGTYNEPKRQKRALHCAFCCFRRASAVCLSKEGTDPSGHRTKHRAGRLFWSHVTERRRGEVPSIPRAAPNHPAAAALFLPFFPAAPNFSYNFPNVFSTFSPSFPHFFPTFPMSSQAFPTFSETFFSVFS